MRAAAPRRHVLAATAAALIAGLVPASLVASSDAQAATGKQNTGDVVAKAGPAHIGVVSYNLFHSNPRADEEIVALTSRPDVDVIGWQEVRARAETLASLDGWDTYRPDGYWPSDDPISWRASVFEVADPGHVMAHARSVSPKMHEKHVVHVTLRHKRTGRLFTFVNGHLNSRIEGHKQGLPGRPNPKARMRVAASQEHLRIIREYMHTMPGTVIATGDFNVAWGADKKAKTKKFTWHWLHPVAKSNWQVFGSKGYLTTHPNTRRNIDHIYVGRRGIRSGAVRLRAHGVWSGYASDHRPVWLRLRVFPMS